MLQLQYLGQHSAIALAEVTLCYTLVISMKGVDKNHGKSLAWTLEVTLCYTLVISMKGVDKNHGKSLARTLEVTLCYTLVISMKGVDKNHGKSLAWTLEVTLCYTLVISMKGVDKNHGKSLTSTLEENLLECTCNKHWQESWPDSCHVTSYQDILLLLVDTCMSHVRPCKSFLIGMPRASIWGLSCRGVVRQQVNTYSPLGTAGCL